MELLFTTIQDVKAIAGGTIESFGFKNLQPDFGRAITFVTDTVSEEVYTQAQEHYKDKNKYNQPDQADETLKALDGLVPLINEVIVWKGLFEYVPEGNVILDNAGFHHQKSNANQVPAFQWAINAVADKYLRNAHTAVEKLLKYLDKNRNNISSWKDSDSEKLVLEMLVPNVATFQESVFIADSRRLFIALLPFMKRLQNKNIKQILGDYYTTIINKLKAKADLSDSEKEIVSLSQPCITNLAMADAVVQFPTQILPEGVVEKYTSFFATQDAAQPARPGVMVLAREFFLKQGSTEITALSKYIHNLNMEEDGGVFRHRPAKSNKGISF